MPGQDDHVVRNLGSVLHAHAIHEGIISCPNASSDKYGAACQHNARLCAADLCALVAGLCIQIAMPSLPGLLTLQAAISGLHLPAAREPDIAFCRAP